VKIYQTGIVGLGNIGFLFDLDVKTRRRYRYPTHASAYAAHPRTQLAAVCDKNPSRLEEICKRYKVERAYTDIVDMLGKESLDILSVCVQADAQGGVVRTAISHGVPLIFCEKPFTTSAKVAKDLLAHAKDAGSSLVVNYWRRFDPSHEEVRRLIQEKSIGTIQQVRCVYGNGLNNVGSHAVDLIGWYIGQIQWVIGVEGITDNPQDPGLDFIVGFENGVRATFSACSYEHYRIFELDFLGSRGRVSIANEGLDMRAYGVRENEDVSGTRQLTERATQIPSTVGNAMYHGVEYLVEVLDRPERVFADHALQTHLVLEAAKESAAAGGKKVFI
jgi:predicted dehydrogenase